MRLKKMYVNIGNTLEFNKDHKICMHVKFAYN